MILLSSLPAGPFISKAHLQSFPQVIDCPSNEHKAAPETVCEKYTFVPKKSKPPPIAVLFVVFQ
jgi:hypothetical protein